MGFLDSLAKILGLKCPKCGSTNIKKLEIRAEVKTTRCKCIACGHEWKCLKFLVEG